MSRWILKLSSCSSNAGVETSLYTECFFIVPCVIHCTTWVLWHCWLGDRKDIQPVKSTASLFLHVLLCRLLEKDRLVKQNNESHLTLPTVMMLCCRWKHVLCGAQWDIGCSSARHSAFARTSRRTGWVHRHILVLPVKSFWDSLWTGRSG